MKKTIIVFLGLTLLLVSLPGVMVSACPPGCDGVGTPGYWKNHPKAWPVDVITIGGIDYSKADAIAWIKTPEKGDKTLTLFRALVAAKLNVTNGCGCPGIVNNVIPPADDWMAEHPVGSGIHGSDAPWQLGEKLYLKLDGYNNGEWCAPARD